MRGRHIALDWELGYTPPGKEGSLKWVPSQVPGAVQLDVARAEGYGPHEFGENWKDYLWMEDVYFTYRSSFPRPDLAPHEKLYFISSGIDYAFEIQLNDTPLHFQEGMFTPVKVDLSEALEEENVLEVTIHPIPKKHPEPADRTQVTESAKPALSYGWDWHPRLVPSGIWDETGLLVQGTPCVEDVHVAYTLSEDLRQAAITLEISGGGLEACQLQWTLWDPEGTLVKRARISPGHSFILDDPVLWWPHDQGDPSLYSYEVELRDTRGQVVQVVEGCCGFRRVKLVMNEGGWADPDRFPKTRNVVPIQLEVNGRRVFAKGSNWVNPEIFPGIISEATYADLLQLAKGAHFNLLRVWGGGIVNKEPFHRLCDELGLMVWQEFPLACNHHEDLPEYLEVLRQEADSIIGRIRKHPSLALWSGGNELFNSWSGMGDQSLALRMLNSRCLELDPLTPFIATSPLYGMGHGHYVFRDPDSGEEVYACMNKARCTAYPEFGIPSPSDVDILKAIIPPEQLWPPAPGTSWESHHAFGAWQGDTWLMQDMIEGYFGPSGNLETLVRHGQLLQCEGYKAIYEEARRQKPYCSMALNWCFNEAWPSAANNNIVSHPARPKPALKAVGEACRPVLASARNFKFCFGAKEAFHCELWLLNDSLETLQNGGMKAFLRWKGGELELGSWHFESIPANANLQGPALSAALPSMPEGVFRLELEVDGHGEWNSSYQFLHACAT